MSRGPEAASQDVGARRNAAFRRLHTISDGLQRITDLSDETAVLRFDTASSSAQKTGSEPVIIHTVLARAPSREPRRTIGHARTQWSPQDARRSRGSSARQYHQDAAAMD